MPGCRGASSGGRGGGGTVGDRIRGLGVSGPRGGGGSWGTHTIWGGGGGGGSNTGHGTIYIYIHILWTQVLSFQVVGEQQMPSKKKTWALKLLSVPSCRKWEPVLRFPMLSGEPTTLRYSKVGLNLQGRTHPMGEQQHGGGQNGNRGTLREGPFNL